MTKTAGSKFRRPSAIAIVLLSVISVASPVAADGDVAVEVVAQRVLVRYLHGVQTTFMDFHAKGPSDDAVVWLIPVPKEPLSVKMTSRAMLNTVEDVTAPVVYSRRQVIMLSATGGGFFVFHLLIACCVVAYVHSEKSLAARLTVLVIAGIACFILFAYLARLGGSFRGPEFWWTANPAKVTLSDTSTPVDVAALDTSSTDEWLEAHRFTISTRVGKQVRAFVHEHSRAIVVLVHPVAEVCAIRSIRFDVATESPFVPVATVDGQTAD